MFWEDLRKETFILELLDPGQSRSRDISKTKARNNFQGLKSHESVLLSVAVIDKTNNKLYISIAIKIPFKWGYEICNDFRMCA